MLIHYWICFELFFHVYIWFVFVRILEPGLVKCLLMKDLGVTNEILYWPMAISIIQQEIACTRYCTSHSG